MGEPLTEPTANYFGVVATTNLTVSKVGFKMHGNSGASLCQE